MKEINEIQFQQDSYTQYKMRHVSMNFHLSILNSKEERRKKITTLLLNIRSNVEGIHYYRKEKL